MSLTGSAADAEINAKEITAHRASNLGIGFPIMAAARHTIVRNADFLSLERTLIDRNAPDNSPRWHAAVRAATKSRIVV